MAAWMQVGCAEVTNVDDALVAVLDERDTVYDAVRQACPDLPILKLGQQGLPTDGARFALAVVAIYGPEDWLWLQTCARSILTVAVSTADDRSDASRAWSAGAFGLLHTRLPQQAMRRAIIGALKGEAAYSRAALGEHIKAGLTPASTRPI